MGRLAFILRHRLPVIIFIIVAVIGGILIFWYISNKEDHNNRNQEISGIQESISDNEYSDTEISGENDFSGYYGQQLSSSIPHGLRAISLPISFFGEVSSIREGDRADIISVFYDPGSNELYSEVILNEKEIIIFENNGKDQGLGEYQDTVDSGYLSEGIFSGISSGNNNSQLKKIIVITFYLETIEVEKAFRAIESGQLYLSLCPADSEG